jgi:hypothetical protein
MMALPGSSTEKEKKREETQFDALPAAGQNGMGDNSQQHPHIPKKECAQHYRLLQIQWDGFSRLHQP